MLEAYENYRKGKDFVLVGCSYLQKGDLNFAVNSALAAVMNTPMLLVHTYNPQHTPLSCFQVGAPPATRSHKSRAGRGPQGICVTFLGHLGVQDLKISE